LSHLQPSHRGNAASSHKRYRDGRARFYYLVQILSIGFQTDSRRFTGGRSQRAHILEGDM
jgi:hypothetical protein